MSEIISSKDIQPVVIQVASAEDAATLARIETGIRTAAQNVVQGYLTIGSYLNEAKGRKIVPHGQWEDWVLYNTGLSLRQAQQLMKAAREIPEGSAMAALPLSKARVILHLPDAEERETLAKRATEENLTVRNLEEQIKQLTNDVSEARKSERRMAQEVQQAQDMRARLDADRRKLEGDRYEMIQKQRERQAEIERLRAALAQAQQQKPQEGISPEAQRQIEALRQELADAEDYAEQQATLRQEAQRQLLEQRRAVDMDGDEAAYWLRTPHAGYGYIVRYVDTDGSLNIGFASNSNGVLAACVIGSSDSSAPVGASERRDAHE